MTRRLSNLLTLLSLPLWAATVAFWIRSHRVGELFMHDSFKNDRMPYVLTSTWFYVDSGGVGFIRHRSTCTASTPAEGRDWFDGYFKEHPAGWTRQTHLPWGYPAVTSAAPPSLQWGGVVVSTEPWPGMGLQSYPCFRMALPFWLLATAFATPPVAAAYRRWRRHHRSKHNRCRACGYDLRATPDRCPECGTETMGQSTLER